MGSSGPKLCGQNRALLDEQNCTVQGFLSVLSKRCLNTKISSSEPGLQLHQHPHRPLADKQLWIPVPKWSQTLNAMKWLCPWTVAISYRVVTNSILPTKMRICIWQRHHAAALTALPGHSALLTTCTNSLGFLVPPVASLEHSCSRKQNSSECQPLLDLPVQQTCIWMQSGQSCSQNEF